MTKAKSAPSRRPAITLGHTDAARLLELAERSELGNPVLADLLFQEIERAKIVQDDKAPADAVGMNAEVEFWDEAHDNARTVRLVYPQDADIAAGRISVLTPVGAGLIGLSVGQSILWPDRDGRMRTLRIEKVQRAELVSGD